MAALEDPIARLIAGSVVARKLRDIEDKQATLVATDSADAQTASLFREETVPRKEAAFTRGRRLLERAPAADHAAGDAIQETARDVLAVPWNSQERAMDEMGGIAPEGVC